MLPARGPRRAQLGWWCVCCAAGLAVLWSATSLASAPATAAPTKAAPTDPVDGAQLYQRWCATCHATDGSGTNVAPSLEDVRVAYLDLTMRTGRMPMKDPSRGVRERRFNDDEREKTVAYLTDLLDLDGDIPEPPEGSAAEGREVYGIYCGECHGAGGGGGLAGDGTAIPPIVGLDAVAIAEAAREGPFAMPRFAEEVISDDELGDLAAFLDEEVHPPATPLGFSEVDRALAALFAGALIATALGLCWWAARQPEMAPHDDGEDAA